MTAIGPTTVLATFLIFCRIGTCLMLMPGFGAQRVPMRVRLFIAVSLTFALAPLLVPEVEPATTGNVAPVALLGLVASEALVGAILGLMARMFLLSLQFAGAAIGMLIGLSNTPDTMIDEDEPAASLTTLITLTATVLIFLTELHWEMLRAVVDSYGTVPVPHQLAANFGLVKLVDAVTDGFMLALRICSPFIVYSLLVNLLFGILGKLTPQIPVYFISIPFVLAGGGFILYFTSAEFLQIFIVTFSQWLQRL
ncbi:flagellar biosynthetic protein FliR [Hyphomicrobium sp. D-2]|uniref:flagellar biosynthetic protein FliR n=1 Tax=Hyphomicrobium sp. D-2 TaxID=3041621 RepID=UPI002457D5FD|nr:flagellar biosynthetic protein FliR [Hyphomicrobium sp. D-2]MDH4983629.1 flagellar biosynthetic protein FliR [Hyphomicrobium sp. D-2]